jgi:HPt (histidine-containing phosphotransfer) domain-containing protein
MNRRIVDAEKDERLLDLLAGVEDTPDLDTDSLLRRCMNRPPLARQLLTLFEDQLPSILDALYAGLRAGDHQVVHQKAHLLCGSAANLSAERLRQIAVVLERRAADRALTPAEAEPIIAAIEAARAAFTAAARAWRA